MDIEIIGPITRVTRIAAGSGIREIRRLRRMYGTGRWRKLKGIATACLPDGVICKVEVHWYEAHGIGRKEIRPKRILKE